MPRLEKEGLLTRWSRLKRESTAKDAERGTPSTAPVTAPSDDATDRIKASEEVTSGTLPELPSLESLTPDSDFEVFMDPRVEDGVRRAALKTLFRSPGFNVTDGLDEYAGDYTKLETLTPAMVAALRHTQRTLFGKQGESGDNVPARSGAIHAEAMQSTGEDRSLATHSEKRGSHAQQGGKDHDSGEPAEGCADGLDTVIVLEDSAGGNAGERLNAKNDGQAGSSRNE